MKIAGKHIGESSVLFIAMILVNAGNYFINLALGRILGPEAFAEASVVATLFLMLSFVAVGVQLTSAKFCAGERLQEDRNKLSSWFHSKVFKSSIALMCILLLASPFIKSYLHFDSMIPLIVLALGLPFFFSMAVKRGIMQGSDQFMNLSKTYIFEMILRMAITFGAVFLVMHFLEARTTEAVAIGFFASFFAASFYKIEKKKTTITKNVQSKIFKFILIIGLYELSQIMINNSDVIMAKHFLSDVDAGLYAAIALIGRVVFFGTWTVVTLLFPKVIQRERDGLPHEKLFWGALAMVAGFGAAIVSCCYIAPELIIGTLFGTEYMTAAGLLWIYALATTLFACANVFAYYHMSLNNYLPVALTLLTGFLQILLINHFHSTMYQMVWVQFFLMSGLLFTMMMYHQLRSLFKLNNIKTTNAIA